MRNVSLLADLLDCEVASFPIKYLGRPLGASFKARRICNGVLEKVEKSYWDGSIFIYQKEEVTSYQSIISNLPIYFLLLFPLLAEVANWIENCLGCFYGVDWGGEKISPCGLVKSVASNGVWWFGKNF